MMKFNHSSAFNKAAFALIASLSLVSLAVPYAMADSKTKEIVTEAPVDMDFKKLDLNSDNINILIIYMFAIFLLLL